MIQLHRIRDVVDYTQSGPPAVPYSNAANCFIASEVEQYSIRRGQAGETDNTADSQCPISPCAAHHPIRAMSDSEQTNLAGATDAATDAVAGAADAAAEVVGEAVDAAGATGAAVGDALGEAAGAAAEATGAAAEAADEAVDAATGKLGGVDWDAVCAKLRSAALDTKNVVVYPLVTGVMTGIGFAAGKRVAERYLYDSK